jgi:hypothetical protein
MAPRLGGLQRACHEYGLNETITAQS